MNFLSSQLRPNSPAFDIREVSVWDSELQRSNGAAERACEDKNDGEHAADDQAVGPLHAVVCERVGEYETKKSCVEGKSPTAFAPERECRRKGSRKNQHQYAGRTGATLQFHVGPKNDSDHNVNRKQHENKRTRKLSPARRHSVSR